MEIFGLVDIPIWSLLILAVCLLLYIKWPEKKIKNLGYPGPDGWPFIGDLIRFSKMGMVEYDKWLVKTYGKVCGVDGFKGIGGVFIADFEILREILVKQASTYFVDRTNFEAFDNPPFRGSMFQTSGEQWKRLRSIISPTFTSGKLKNVQPLVSVCANRLCDTLEQKALKDEVFDVKNVFGAYTMNVIASTAFGLDLDTQKNPNNEFCKHAATIDNLGFGDIQFILSIFFPSLFAWTLQYWGGIARAGKFYNGVVAQTISQRKQTSEEYHDYLQLLLNAHKLKDDGEDAKPDEGKVVKKALTDEEVVANAFMFFVGGYSTTNNTLSYFAYLVATHPEVQDKVIEEVDQVLQGAAPDYDNISKLPYMGQCLDETMRLYPLAPRLDRVSVKDVTIKGLKFPKGTSVQIPVGVIHRDPEIYLEPDEFDPSRFTPEAKAARDPFAFMPFGMGPRNCVGMRLALIELKVALASIFQKFRLVTCEETEIPLIMSKDRPFQPENAIKLKVVTRN